MPLFAAAVAVFPLFIFAVSTAVISTFSVASRGAGRASHGVEFDLAVIISVFEDF